MQFNSYLFVLGFILPTVFLYYVANRVSIQLGKVVIIVACLIFYAYERVDMLIFLGTSMVVNYILSQVIRRRSDKKPFMILAVVANILFLLYFKYFDFGITNVNSIFGTSFALKDLILPLGISFYTFQQIAYVVSVYRGEVEGDDIIDYCAYILYFPKILMGPLMEPVDFINQFNDQKRKSPITDNIASGVKIFSFGLLKKALVADTFSKAVTVGYQNFDGCTPLDFAFITLFYSLEIYFDFSGYTDMAVGVSQMLGIDLPMNFDSPYKAVSIRDFWKRWHISLTKFFTKYLYIPLGGNRKGTARTYINTMIVFLVSGFWHGANWTFVLWGFLHGIFSLFDRSLDKIFVGKRDNGGAGLLQRIRWLLTFMVVSILWLLFSADSIGQWAHMLTSMLAIRDLSVTKDILMVFKLQELEPIIDLLRLGSMDDKKIGGLCMVVFTIISLFVCFVPQNNYRNRSVLKASGMIMAAAAFVWGVLCLGGESTFVYFGF